MFQVLQVFCAFSWLFFVEVFFLIFFPALIHLLSLESVVFFFRYTQILFFFCKIFFLNFFSPKIVSFAQNFIFEKLLSNHWKPKFLHLKKNVMQICSI